MIKLKASCVYPPPRSIIVTIRPIVYLMLTICFFLLSSLSAINLYVDGDLVQNGDGTIDNPYNMISYAINAAHNYAEPNTIHIKGRNNANYYNQNLSISGFQHPLTLKRWLKNSNELIIKGTGRTLPTIKLVNNTATSGNDPVTIKIMGATISRALEPQIASELKGGGIAIENSESVVIEDCVINHCRAWKGGGIYAYQSNLELINTKMHNNTGVRYTGAVLISFGGAIYAEDSEITVSESLLYFNHGGPQTACEETIYMYGGLLSCGATTLYHNSSTAVQVWTNEGDAIFQNCIIYQPYMNVNAEYTFCCAYNTQYSSFWGLGNIIAAPLFNADFSLQKGSPCIGAGYSDLYYDHLGDPGNQDLITVHDETQDMGGVPYDYDRFAYYEYDDHPQGNWMCFPVIDDQSEVIIDNTPYRSDNMRAFFYDYEGSQSFMDYVSFKWYDPLNVFKENKHYPDNTIKWHYMHGINSDKGFLGYKVVFNSPVVTDKFHGYHVHPQAWVEVPEHSVENWIGYFIPQTQTSYMAFGSYMDELYYIQHKNWTMARTSIERGAPWIVQGQLGTPRPSISYGDMVIVKRFAPDGVNPDIAEFQWKSLGQSQKYVREQPEYFSFDMLPEYTAIFVEVDSFTTAKELAIMSNDQCYGAAVVTEGTVMIPAFISTLPEGSELQLVSWDGAKSEIKPISMNLFDPDHDSFIKCSAFNKSDADYYLINIGSNPQEDDAPPAQQFSIQNYPNPFNPSTTIKYSVPTDGEVVITIHNIRGQVVKTLISDYKSDGLHQEIWNGKDQQENNVATGIYFVRIQTKDSSLTHKMIMLK